MGEQVNNKLLGPIIEQAAIDIGLCWKPNGFLLIHSGGAYRHVMTFMDDDTIHSVMENVTGPVSDLINNG